MEEQIKKLQEELESVKYERDILILSSAKKFIISQLENKIPTHYYDSIKEALLDGRYLVAINNTHNTAIMQSLIDTYSYDLVVECMTELFVPEEEDGA